jgi:hypothetical protein
MHVHPAHFGAAIQRRHRLAGIQQAARVEGMLDRVEPLELADANWTHIPPIFESNAVLAGDRAADFDSKFQNFSPNASVFSTSPGQLASNRTRGCRLPSPAWKTFMQRSLNSLPKLAIRVSTGAIERRGIVPSMQ